MKYLELTILTIIVMFVSGAIIFSINQREVDKAYKKGKTDGNIETLKFISEWAEGTLKDTTKVHCADFYINKDTIHLPAWSKAIKVKTKNLK